MACKKSTYTNTTGKIVVLSYRRCSDGFFVDEQQIALNETVNLWYEDNSIRSANPNVVNTITTSGQTWPLTPTPTPSTSSAGVTPTPTPTPTETPTNTPTGTLGATPTQTETPTPTVTETPTETPTNTPTESETPTPTVTETPTETPTNTPTETPTNTPTPSVTPVAITGYGYNLVVLPYEFPTSGNTIMTEQGIGQSGTTDPNVFVSNGNGIYFNSIDNTSTNRTDYFSGFTGQSVTITLTQNGDSAIYSGDTNAFQSWSFTGGTGFVFGYGIAISGYSSGTTVLIQSATTTWVTGQTVYISAEINVPITPTPTPTESETPTPTPTGTEPETPTPTPTESETPTPTPTGTEPETPTPTPTGTEPETPTPTVTETPTETPTNTPTESETPTPTVTETPTETPTPTVTETPTETPTPTVTPS